MVHIAVLINVVKQIVLISLNIFYNILQLEDHK